MSRLFLLLLLIKTTALFPQQLISIPDRTYWNTSYQYRFAYEKRENKLKPIGIAKMDLSPDIDSRMRSPLEKRLQREQKVLALRLLHEEYASLSIEELIAEIGSCHLQSYVGIAPIELSTSAAYIQGWLGKLRNDKRCIIYASGQAQKATDYILHIESDKNEEFINTETESV